MNMFKVIISNAYILIIPILVWNVLLASKLPAAFGPENFDRGIPQLILSGEKIFRVLVFIFPLFIKLSLKNKYSKLGFILYLAGILLYFLSWIMLIYTPDSTWSMSAVGFTAPAYLPLIWLIGISILADSYYFPIEYKNWHYQSITLIFSLFHISHTLLVYLKLK